MSNDDAPTDQTTPPNHQNAIRTNGEPVNEPTNPPDYLLQYNTDRYEPYDPIAKNAGTPYTEPFQTGGYKHFDGYALVTSPYITLDTFKTLVLNGLVPRASGVRLDDLAAGCALLLYEPAERYRFWPSEFDKKGMIRATRMPLGLPFVVDVKMGDLDVDGKPCTSPGKYYGWWGGIHALVGKEGLEANLYKIRPSWEKLNGRMGFKVGYKKLSSTNG